MVEVTEKTIEALKAAKEVADVAAGLTSCRSDDEFVWAAQAKINAALEAALASPAEAVEPVAYACEADIKALASKPKGADISLSPKAMPQYGMKAALYLHPPQQEPARLREALIAAKAVVDVAAGLTSCRSDDEFVWAAQAKINAALAEDGL